MLEQRTLSLSLFLLSLQLLNSKNEGNHFVHQLTARVLFVSQGIPYSLYTRNHWMKYYCDYIHSTLSLPLSFAFALCITLKTANAVSSRSLPFCFIRICFIVLTKRVHKWMVHFLFKWLRKRRRAFQLTIRRVFQFFTNTSAQLSPWQWFNLRERKKESLQRWIVDVRWKYDHFVLPPPSRLRFLLFFSFKVYKADRQVTCKVNRQ